MLHYLSGLPLCVPTTILVGIPTLLAMRDALIQLMLRSSHRSCVIRQHHLTRQRSASEVLRLL